MYSLFLDSIVKLFAQYIDTQIRNPNIEAKYLAQEDKSEINHQKFRDYGIEEFSKFF